MHHGTRNSRELKVRHYAARLTKINKYLAVFTGLNLNKTIGETEINKIILHSMPNYWGKKDLLQGFILRRDLLMR